MSDDDPTPAAATPEDAQPKRRGRKGDPDLVARMAALGAQTGQATPKPVDRSARTTRRSRPVTAASTEADAGTTPTGEKAARRAPARRAPARPPAAMPPEQPKAVTYSERINLTTTPEQNRALAQARVDDGIDKTARLRAMIALWQQDERIRKRIDKLAREWR